MNRRVPHARRYRVSLSIPMPTAAPGYVTKVAYDNFRAQPLRSSPARTLPVIQTYVVRAITLRPLHGSCEEKASFRARAYGKGVAVATSIYMYPERAPDARSPKLFAPAPVLLDGHRYQ